MNEVNVSELLYKPQQYNDIHNKQHKIINNINYKGVVLSNLNKLLNSKLILLLITTLTALVSFNRFSRCVTVKWMAPQSYELGCYTDYVPLFWVHNFADHVFPYAHANASLEYPPLITLTAYLTALFSPSNATNPLSFFYITCALMVVSYFVITLVVSKLNKQSVYLFLLAPASIFSIFINWDLIALLPLVLSILYFQKSESVKSGLLLSLATSAKFIPVFLLLPANIKYFREKDWVGFRKFNTSFVVSWLVVNVPLLVMYPQGFMYFYKFNLKRLSDLGSYWLAFDHFFSSKSNHVSTFVSILILVSTLLLLIKNYKDIDLQSYSLLIVGAVMVTSKVYSPQYTLWLTLLAVIHPQIKKNILPFISWQAGELIYNLVVWPHLITMAGSSGVSDNVYYGATLLRISLFIYFIYSLYVGNKSVKKNEILS